MQEKEGSERSIHGLRSGGRRDSGRHFGLSRGKAGNGLGLGRRELEGDSFIGLCVGRTDGRLAIDRIFSMFYMI